jgi:hypothetical protein
MESPQLTSWLKAKHIEAGLYLAFDVDVITLERKGQILATFDAYEVDLTTILHEADRQLIKLNNAILCAG